MIEKITVNSELRIVDYKNSCENFQLRLVDWKNTCVNSQLIIVDWKKNNCEFWIKNSWLKN